MPLVIVEDISRYRVDTTIDLHLQKLARRALDGNLGAPDRAGAIDLRRGVAHERQRSTVDELPRRGREVVAGD